MHRKTITRWFSNHSGALTLVVIVGVVLGMIAFGVMS